MILRFTMVSILAICTLSHGLNALAANPVSMHLTYNPDTQILSIETYHHTDERFTHYINNFTVSVNGGTIQRYFQQGQTSSGVALKKLKVKATAGDTLLVTASCTEKGEIHGELILTESLRKPDSHIYQVTIEKLSGTSRPKREWSYTHPGYPYHHAAQHPSKSQQDDKSGIDQAPVVEHVPQKQLSPAQQHKLEVEQKVNRRAYEAKFGPLQSPDYE